MSVLQSHAILRRRIDLEDQLRTGDVLLGILRVKVQLEMIVVFITTRRKESQKTCEG